MASRAENPRRNAGPRRSRALAPHDSSARDQHVEQTGAAERHHHPQPNATDDEGVEPLAARSQTAERSESGQNCPEVHPGRGVSGILVPVRDRDHSLCPIHVQSNPVDPGYVVDVVHSRLASNTDGEQCQHDRRCRYRRRRPEDDAHGPFRGTWFAQFPFRRQKNTAPDDEGEQETEISLSGSTRPRRRHGNQKHGDRNGEHRVPRPGSDSDSFDGVHTEKHRKHDEPGLPRNPRLEIHGVQWKEGDKGEEQALAQ